MMRATLAVVLGLSFGNWFTAPRGELVVDPLRAKARAAVGLVFTRPVYVVEAAPVPVPPPPPPAPKPDDKPKPKAGQIADESPAEVERTTQVWMFSRPRCGDCERNKLLIESNLKPLGWTVGERSMIRIIDPKESPTLVQQAEVTFERGLPVSTVMVRQHGRFVRSRSASVFQGYWGNTEIFEKWANEVKR
jgi:hypothetical protein